MTASRGGALGMRGLSPAAVVLSTTKVSQLVDGAAAAIRDAINVGRTNAVAVQRDEYVRQLAKDFKRDRCVADRQLTAFVVDIALRGSLEDAMEVGERLIEAACMAHEAAHPERAEAPFVELHLAEERAEGEAEEAETRMAHHPHCLAAKEDYVRKGAAHTHQRVRMDRRVRRDIILAHVARQRGAVS